MRWGIWTGSHVCVLLEFWVALYFTLVGSLVDG